MANLEDVLRDADDDMHLPGEDLLERLLGRIGGVANAQAVFGEPVDRDGVTVIPVARVRWGGGSGGGSGVESDGKAGEGRGGGGGVSASPAGYIELRAGDARFVRIIDWSSLWPLALAGGAGLWMVFRGLRSILNVR